MAWNFARELERWGPRASNQEPSAPCSPNIAEARAYCAYVAKSHYENFTVASLLLPRRLIRHFHAVYSYCRWSDDLADETAGGDTALQLIAWWRSELLTCYEGRGLVTPHPEPLRGSNLPLKGGGVKSALNTEQQSGQKSGLNTEQQSGQKSALNTEQQSGQKSALTSHLDGEVGGTIGSAGWGGITTGIPRHPVAIALRETIRRFNIPPKPFLDLLIAFEQDQHIKRYDTFEQLLGYCRNSANPVGHLVLYLFECFDTERARLADEVCTGLQLANFWQDVARDFAIGRVYLPAEDRAQFGYSDDDLAAQKFTPQFRELMRFEVERTSGYFDRGEHLLPLLPRSARVDVDLFIRGGRAILREIERIDFNVWSRRPEVSKVRKAQLLFGALVRSWM